MNCTRCQGLMVPDRFIDLEETGHLWMSGWRCMNCGHIVDAVTEENRKLQAQGLLNVVPQLKKPKAAADPLSPAPPVSMSCPPEIQPPTLSTMGNESQAA